MSQTAVTRHQHTRNAIVDKFIEKSRTQDRLAKYKTLSTNYVGKNKNKEADKTRKSTACKNEIYEITIQYGV